MCNVDWKNEFHRSDHLKNDNQIIFKFNYLQHPKKEFWISSWLEYWIFPNETHFPFEYQTSPVFESPLLSVHNFNDCYFCSRSSQVGNYISKHRSRVKWGKVRACMLKTFTRMKKRWGFLIYQFALPALQVNPHESQFSYLQPHCVMSLFQMGREVRLTSAVTIWIPNTWNPNIGLFRIFLSGFQMV